jgi:hypothetical protein
MGAQKCNEHEWSCIVSDAVEHPAHYNALPVECIDVVEHFDFCTGNAIKYLWRAGLKPGTDAVTDLRKLHGTCSAIARAESEQTK